MGSGIMANGWNQKHSIVLLNERGYYGYGVALYPQTSSRRTECYHEEKQGARPDGLMEA